MPSMALLVDEFSYYIFAVLRFEEERIHDWLNLPPMFWHTQKYFRKFKEFAATLISTNDHAERSVGMMEQFVHKYSNEEEKQERLLAVDATRFAMKERGRKSNSTSKRRMAESLCSIKKKMFKD